MSIEDWQVKLQSIPNGKQVKINAVKRIKEIQEEKEQLKQAQVELYQPKYYDAIMNKCFSALQTVKISSPATHILFYGLEEREKIIIANQKEETLKEHHNLAYELAFKDAINWELTDLKTCHDEEDFGKHTGMDYYYQGWKQFIRGKQVWCLCAMENKVKEKEEDYRSSD